MPKGFLDLPYELRRHIYCYCIPHRKRIQVSLGSPSIFHHDRYTPERMWNPKFSEINVLRLSKQISEECLDILYGENIFCLTLDADGEYSLQKMFTEKSRRRLRSLIVTANEAHTSNQRANPDVSLWATILPGLKSLLIFLEQPITTGSYYNAPALKEEIDGWVRQIGPYLECFGKYIPETLSARVDDDGKKEARELVQKYLPSNCRLQRSMLGDLMFKRGYFSPESGYWDDYYDGPTSSMDV